MGKGANSADDSAGAGAAAVVADEACIEWVRQRLTSVAPTIQEVWSADTHLSAVNDFLTSASCGRLFAYVRSTAGADDCPSDAAEPPADGGAHGGRRVLTLQTTVPPAWDKLLYMVRDTSKLVTADNIGQCVHFGLVNGGTMDNMLQMMAGVYVPAVIGNKTWPDSVRKEFMGQLHKFMANLTEAAFEAKGRTVLYIPNEELGRPDVAAAEKDLVQRLESTLIHWTRQIKEVILNQDNSEVGEEAGPLAEIEFWRSRSVDLSGIRTQLDDPGVARIVGVLEIARSSYLSPFSDLSSLIQHEAAAAEDNLKFVSRLEAPCQALSKAEPEGIPLLLPTLLHCIRMIWNISGFYNTPERLTGLLRKVSNEIINRCSASISLSDIFDGDLESAMGALRQSIRAGEAWKRAYRSTTAAISRAGERAWDFDVSSIFAHIDAFVQRCRDMLEVCEAQTQFAPRTRLPAFGGARGPEISKSLLDIQASFRRLVVSLRSLDYNILDVKATRWHDDYNSFKSGVKDLEVMMQRVIALAFESVSDLFVKVELLEAFQAMAKRESISRAVEKKTAEVYAAFIAELNATRKHFDSHRRSPPVDPAFPRHSGAALWALGLQRRIDKPMARLEKAVPYLPHAGEADELRAVHEGLSSAIEMFIKDQNHNQWFNSLDASLSLKLDNTLIAMGDDGLLRVNFDKQVLSMFAEVRYWERLNMEIPYVAMEISSQREKFRVLCENVKLVVRDYNRVVTSLDASERRLFANRIHHLDRRIAPGIHKLQWTSPKHTLDYYVREARKYAGEAYRIVLEWQAVNARIAANARLIAETSLISIEKKRVYEQFEFEERQREHRELVRARFEKAHSEIQATLEDMYQTFAQDSQDVQEAWHAYTSVVDKRLLAALRTAVKRSLLELSRALTGDGKTEVTSIFTVSVVLNPQKCCVELKPSVQDLFNMIHNVSRELVSVLKAVPRIAEPTRLGGEEYEPPALPTFFDIISTDDDTTLKTIVSITTGITKIVDKVQQFTFYWSSKYKHIYDQDKDAHMRRYEEAKKPLASFDSDIVKYRDLQDKVQGEDTSINMSFLHLDSAPLKQALVAHCEEWAGRFLKLLNALAADELRAIHSHFSSTTEELRRPVVNLDMLADSVALLKRTVADAPHMEARFEPLEEKYRVLEKFDHDVGEQEQALRESLQPSYAAFCAMLQETELDLERAKEQFREQLQKMVAEFTRRVAEQRELFSQEAPFTVEGFTHPQAVEYIEGAREEVASNRKREAELAKGLEIFTMAPPPYKELDDTERDLALLEGVWAIIDEWQRRFDGWKDGKFRELEVSAMEEEAVRVNKKIAKIGREIRQWPVWQHIRATVDSFKLTMPLITDLRNEAMRPRHWEQLMELIGERFDPQGDDFTLGRVSEFRLDTFADKIGELSSNASKELQIEVALEKIDEKWQVNELDMVPHKEGVPDVYRLRSAEDVFNDLEENIVALSTMKSSRFFLSFEDDITKWERALSLVSEMIEIILQVQRNWMYLENIFVGSEDIRKQLPAESNMFDFVDTTFKRSMLAMFEAKNVLKATHLPKMLDTFQDMDAKLERIQKSLDAYLEKKRQQFPRFYFLSSDDLLEILGQAKDPLNVQPHFKKCFEGIKKLDMHAPALAEGRRHFEASAMTSPDGETLPFADAVKTEGRPEDWLNDVEATMYATTKHFLLRTIEEAKGMKKDRWVKEFPGQCIISAGQVLWTADCERALSDAETSKAALKLLKKKWVNYLNKLTAITRSKLNKVERKKTVALITIEVHARDVIEKLVKAGCSSDSAFEWVSQLRFYWDREINDCVVKQVLSIFKYGYEYQGNNGRLVITPLTDRCYMTLGAAMFTRRGGNPLGPAGTGKTETVKDFGKALARYVIVFNCSDGVDYKMTAKMFSGLAQTGAWSCLDEFNRIEVEVLSVVATQISVVMSAIKAGKSRFIFEGEDIRLIPSCGIFVTMNPGYAGRSELPDNLKALVRPVSMMVPDFTLIAEIMLFSEGFQTAKPLSKKMISIMELSPQQLSKQDHYDYGLRSFVIPIARAAGALKRADPDVAEDFIMYRTMLDLIKPKLVYADLPLFQALLSDLFPGLELNDAGSAELRAELEAQVRAAGLQIVPDWITKMVQIFDCKVARHGNMIVGKTGAGKSEAWKCLTRAMAELKKRGAQGEYERVTVHTINPLSLSNDELYGSFDAATHEWSDGVLAKLMRTICRDEGLDQKWVLFDGPVDTLWIESMNTLLDDNKLLTLLSGERISMPAQVSLLFEVEDLSVASPATVSRAGMIYMNTEDLGWQPFVTSWLERKTDAAMVQTLRRMVDKYVGATLEFKRLNCAESVPVDQLSSVRYTCALFDSLATAENGVDPSEGDERLPLVEMWFLYALIWAMGGTVDEEGRKKFDMFLRELDARYPSQDTVFEYYVDPKKKVWTPWEEKLGAAYRPAPDTPFFKMVVPTVDTLRTRAVLDAYVRVGRHALLTGNVGVGKTLVIEGLLAALPSSKSSVTINFSAQTGAKSLQETIEGNLEKRTKGVFAPVGGKKLAVFCDDLNMPAKSVFGFMPPLELLKLWMDNGFWYDRQRQEVKHVKDMQLLGAMAPPGGGRNAFSQRILSCFGVLNMTAPSDAQVRRIFGALLSSRLSDFDDEIKPLSEPIAAATTEIYNAALEHLLPTPSKCTYLFNLRDVGKIVQGVLQASRSYYDSRESLLQLWCHETQRVLSDRMWSSDDKTWLVSQIDKRLNEDMSTSWGALFDRGEVPPFVSFMREVESPPYEAVNDMNALKDLLTEKLEDYNLEPGTSAMDLVLFRDAMHHLCRIHRVLCLPRGNALLVGIGGSGRKSMARLAAYVAELKVFSIEITKNYRLQEFYEDLKMLFKQAGASNKPTVFLFDDQQIVHETFLEAINNILTSGIVPNIFPKDELSPILDECRADAKKVGMGDTADQVFKFFLERVRSNLHVVLCLSPIGEAFRNRVRMFPGLVNCTTIDWFTEWPGDALFEVAAKLLEEESLGSDEVRTNICKVFVTAHTSVSEASDQMLRSLKRHNYVTPTNYLETLNTYRMLLKEKRASVGEQANKLSGGLEKLGETSVQVGEMQVVCEDKKVVVAKAKKDCEELLVEIVQEKRIVDEQEKTVNAEAAKIEKEAAETQVIADDCQRDLDKAMPALNAAVEALNVLTKKDLSEVKAYAKPPPAVETTLNAVLTVLKRPAGWDEAKKQLNDSAFLTKLMEYDKDLLNDALLKKIGKFTGQEDFTPDKVGKVSGACRGLCLWVHAMDTYGHVARDVAPKRAKLKAATDTLNKKQKALKQAKAQLAEVQAKVQALKDKYEQSTSSKEALQREAEDLELKLQRAEKLVNGLAGEKGRWEASIGVLQEQLTQLPGDVMMAAAFMSYAGPFPKTYREELVEHTWMKQLQQLAVPSSPKFDFAGFLADPSDVRDWNIQGLPSDSFSTENGVMVTRGRRWPLMIDPQSQANQWVRAMEAKNGLQLIDLQMPGYIRTVENAVQFGSPVLLQNILEEIDPILEPLLSKAFIKKGNSTLIKIGDKELDFSPDFKLYITTKLSNPHYQPEISTKAMICNFALSEQGLEAQLLNTIVKKERPDLDQQKGELVVKVAAGKRKQAELEDTILYMLSTATGSLLDNVELINTLDSSKVTWEEVNESLKVSEETSEMIDQASSAYQPSALRASALYFVLSDLAMIDPMYQFSLDAYQELFLTSIAKSDKSEVIAERIKNLNDYHTYAVYRYTSRGLFEKHKLLLSMQLCVKILQSSDAVNMQEWTYLLRGGFVVDKAAQPANPAPAWISEEMWDNVSMLEELPNFKGVVASFEQASMVWEWYREGEPEVAELPGEWEAKCDELQRLVFVRCLRPDRVIFAATSYVANNLGRKFVEPPVLDLGEVYVDSNPLTPIIFVLSPGVDPTSNLRQLAQQQSQDDLVAIALGQGQAPHATKAIEAAVGSGGWVFLANCHLMTSWLPALEKIIEDLPNKKPHANFRLWLSSNPTADFPINILQGALKLTTEPPRGLRANLLRMYSTVSEESFAECRNAQKYSKLLFCLAYFHSVLLERRKFQSLGLNIPYDFNDTDFAVSDDLLKTYLDEYAEVPWDALKYLISEANYGGRVTDELDRRVLNSYLEQFYCEDALNVPNYPLSTLTHYYVPEHGTLQSYRDYILTLPSVDDAEAFAQHPNADISYMIHDSKTILNSLVSLLPRQSEGEGTSTDDIVTSVLEDLTTQVPGPWNLEEVQKAKAGDPSALHVVLFQEVERYNVLLSLLHQTCEATKKGIKGLVVMSAELDSIFNAVAAGKVPDAWKKTYPSLKPLGSWMRDLVQRVEELNQWITGSYPSVYWLSGFTYPTCFLTAVLQTTARRDAIPIDTLSWDFSVVNLNESEIAQPPKDGVYIKGIFLEGAGWDFDNGCLTEPEPQELIVSMPILHFKPVENKKKSARGLYSSPLYLYPLRTGTRERPSYMISVDLKAGAHDSDVYVKRGTALLLALDQ